MDPLPEETPEAQNPPPPTPVLPEERNWAMLAHLSALAGLCIFTTHLIPFGNIFGPLLVWLFKRDTSAFVEDQAKEALNAQISVTIYAIAACLLLFVLIGFLLLPALWIANIAFIIRAAIVTNGGKAYRYPCILRLVR